MDLTVAWYFHKMTLFVSWSKDVLYNPQMEKTKINLFAFYQRQDR